MNVRPAPPGPCDHRLRGALAVGARRGAPGAGADPAPLGRCRDRPGGGPGARGRGRRRGPAGAGRVADRARAGGSQLHRQDYGGVRGGRAGRALCVLLGADQLAGIGGEPGADPRGRAARGGRAGPGPRATTGPRRSPTWPSTSPRGGTPPARHAGDRRLVHHDPQPDRRRGADRAPGDPTRRGGTRPRGSESLAPSVRPAKPSLGNPLELTLAAASLAGSKNARDIGILDMRGLVLPTPTTS